MRLNLNKINILFILLFFINIFFFYNFTPIDFECDAGSFFSAGKFFYDFIFSPNYEFQISYRPPGFSIFNIFTGLYLFDSFYPWIFLNYFFSFFTLIMFNLFFNKFDKITLIFGNIILLLSNILLIHSKLFLEMHLITNMIFLNIFCCYYFFKTNKIKFFYISILLSIYLFFTRFDLIFILIFDYFYLNFLLYKKNSIRKFFINFFIISSICSLTLFIWLFAKHIFLDLTNEDKFFKDKSEFFIGSFTSLNHQTGAQLMWRLNNDLRNSIKLKDPDNYIYNFLSLENGPYSKILYDTLNEALKSKDLKEKIKYFSNKMHPLDPMFYHLSDSENYNRHYGKYIDKEPNKIVEQMFSNQFESFYYPLQIQIILIEHIGRIKTDKLLKNVSYEIINSNPVIKTEISHQFLESISLSLRDNKNLFFNASNDLVWFNIKPINIGNCAFLSLTQNLYSQYENEFIKKSHTKNDFSNKLFLIVSYLKNLIFEFTGFVLIISIPYLLINFKNNKFTIFLYLKYFSTVFIISVFSPIVGHKYDNYLSVFMIMIVCLIINNFSKRFYSS